MSKVTIKDIAREVGFSPTTVSNVINGRYQKVSAETIRKIDQAIDDLKYVPDFSARSLVSKRSRMIGVIIPQTESHQQFLLENPFYSELVSGIEHRLREKGYYMMLCGVDKDTTYLDVLVNWNLDALILLGIYEEGLYTQLKEVKVPVLLMDSYIEDDYFYHLRIDDELGGYLATKHLIDKGHREIAIVSGELKAGGVTEKRVLGFKRALLEANVPFDPSRLYEGSVSYQWGIEAAQMIADQPEVTAVFCNADMIAAGMMSGLQERGIHVPDQLSVIGFDNLFISEMTFPALTTVDQNIFEKGERAAQTALEIIDREGTAVDRIQLMPIAIIERKSVRTRQEEVT